MKKRTTTKRRPQASEMLTPQQREHLREALEQLRQLLDADAAAAAAQRAAMNN